MTFVETRREEYQDNEGDPYWIEHRDTLTISQANDKICITGQYHGSYHVTTSIALSKKDAIRLKDELARLIDEL